MTRGRRVLVLARSVAVALALLVVAACGGEDTPTLEVMPEDTSTPDYEYVIPKGTNTRITRGEVVELMPSRLEVQVGESIRIRNEDSAGAFVGIFYVGAGETVNMRFTTPGELTGKCEVSSSGEFTIDVREA